MARVLPTPTRPNQYPMFFSACGPSRSANCAKYKLRGATATPCESTTPSPSNGSLSKGRGLRVLSPTLPINQFTAPGGFCTMKSFASQFQITPHPTPHPPPHPPPPPYPNPTPPPPPSHSSLTPPPPP